MSHEIGKEKLHINLARYKFKNDVFEIDVDPDKAIDFKKGKDVDIKEVLHSEHIFSDAKKGMLASAIIMKTIFGTDDTLEIAKKIIMDGEIQLTESYRQKVRDQKKRQILNTLHRNCVNPKNHAPYPLDLLERAFDEAKINIDFNASTNDILDEALRKIKLQIPIKFEVKEIEVHIPGTFAPKCYNLLNNFGKLLKEDWQNDGALLVTIEVPGGMEADFYDKLNSLTHGGITAKVLKIR